MRTWRKIISSKHAPSAVSGLRKRRRELWLGGSGNHSLPSLPNRTNQGSSSVELGPRHFSGNWTTQEKLIGLQLCHLTTYKTATSTVGGFGRLGVILLNHVTFVFLFFSFITLQKSPKSKGLGVLTPGAETVCHFPSTATCD